MLDLKQNMSICFSKLLFSFLNEDHKMNNVNIAQEVGKGKCCLQFYLFLENQ